MMKCKELVRLADLGELSKEDTVLFGYFRSSSSWRIRIALNMKQMDHKYVGIHLVKNDQNSEEYKKYNPSGLVPTLWIDGEMLTESMAILEYLDETRPENPIMPKGALEKQKVRQLCEHVNGNMQPLQNLRVLKKVGEDFNADKIAWATYWNVLGMESLDKMLEKTAGKYAFGDSVTMADICIFPQAFGAAKRFNINLEAYPTLNKVINNCLVLQAFKDAMPQNQPDWEDAPAPQPPK